jgi:sigma-B regulation protein RsbU (phosphoserine phosphatase)
MKTIKSFPRRSIWSSLLLVLVAALTLAATSLIQYYYAQKEIRNEANTLAEDQLEITKSQINDVLNQAEAAVRNSMWIAQWCIDRRDSLFRITQRVVEDNPVVVGSTIAFVPGYFDNVPLLAPYSFRDRTTGELQLRSLATPEYDYPSKEWFVKALNCESGYWSEPYLDEGGGDMLMTTFSMPVKDEEGTVAAVLTADISLYWLTNMVGDVKIYPNAFSIMTSQTGELMVCPVQSFIMKKTIQEVVASMNEDTASYNALVNDLISGKIGNTAVRYQGKHYFVYHAPVERTGWTMSIVIPKDEIFGDLMRMKWRVRLLQILGLLMLVVILRSVARNQKKYQALSEKKERMESELKIASNIQMSMIPKVFPPFPERHDIDMCASLVPAREVGGDLYDFFIRDEKLFFCIGDVSGKGVPASLVMAVTRSLFRAVTSHESSPGKIVTIMNKSMSEMNENNMFVTFFCGILDLADGHLKYCNAGHNAPMILTNSKSMLDVVPNLPLGILTDMSFQEQEVDMHYDDALFLYTDGLTEAENSSNELFGLKRVASVLSARRSAQEHLEVMEKNVADFVGDAPQSDDLTMLFIHYLNETPAACKERHLVLDNDVSQIPLLEEFLESLVEEEKLDPGVFTMVNLALEEAVTNVMMYAYPKGTEGIVDILARVDGDKLEFTITDSGMAFDPTAIPEVDITAGVEERKIGGLGIHMVRNIMDTLRYERVDGKNILSMTKNI